MEQTRRSVCLECPHPINPLVTMWSYRYVFNEESKDLLQVISMNKQYLIIICKGSKVGFQIDLIADLCLCKMLHIFSSLARAKILNLRSNTRYIEHTSTHLLIREMMWL